MKVSAPHRCFLALRPDPSSRAALARLAASAPGQRSAAGTRAVAATDLHLTLRFLGATTPRQIEALRTALPRLARPLETQAARALAIWPNRLRPRMLVLELRASNGLQRLAADCEALARELDFHAETRPFRAHVTLARLRGGTLPQLDPADCADAGFDTLALLESLAQPDAQRYRTLAALPMPQP